jgi:hypothetical protein
LFFWNDSDDLNLTSGHEATLRRTTITMTQPGAILQDVATLLDQLPLTLTSTHRLSGTLLESLNATLTDPIAVDFKRPTQKSYPPLLGLHILLRASGLTLVDAAGKKPALRINEPIFNRWQQMSLTERWGHLLESWLLRGHLEAIGEEGYSRVNLLSNYAQIMAFYQRTGNDNYFIVDGSDDLNELMLYRPERHNLGLLRAFGMIDIESDPPEPGGGWNIKRVRVTPFGEALIHFLANRFYHDKVRLLDLKASDAPLTGLFQPIFQPYFPEWKTVLQTQAVTFQAGVYTFKVSLGSVWRRIEISGDRSFADMVTTILRSFAFDHDHLYEFTYRDAFGIKQTISHPYMDDPPFVDDVRIGEVGLHTGHTLKFLFDFGASWEFKLKLESIDTARTDDVCEVIKAKGEPPEQYPGW